MSRGRDTYEPPPVRRFARTALGDAVRPTHGVVPGSGRWVAPFGLGTADTNLQARRLVRRAIAAVEGDDRESQQARQALRATLDDVPGAPDRPLTLEQALRLELVGREAARVAAGV